jgi:UDP-glucuronate decarboxylase
MHPNDGRVVSNFIVQALKGEPITLYGTGSQTRSFCYVDDLVTGKIAMMDQDAPVRRRPDITLAKEKLRWEPTISLRDGLTRTIDYFRSHLGVLLV